jgi:rubrerythrin
MIAQGKSTNDVVDLSEVATVQAVMDLLSRRPTSLSSRWICETCGMIHTGPAPTSCESCGGSVSLAHPDDIPREMGSRW